MELEIKNNRSKKFKTFSGFLSFLLALISLAGLNATLLLKTEGFPDLFLVQLPTLGLFVGGVGLLTKRKKHLYTWCGIGLNTFILLFTLLMILFSLSINYKP
ncbi:hypothetical protein J7E71_18820 [Mesobacillus foraminis]|uniref:hypothetical protein n=1 Tax=Mesobacillus foraminis TaxID=279826 RepID=UPI001BE5180F|nr:hypothetical protein [Mesobacillus foraminis]MBT2757930.1 hypothetical protein [Mesobacillus foraminis]